MCFVPDHAGTYFALVISKKLDAGLINGWHPNWQVQIQMIGPAAPALQALQKILLQEVYGTPL